MSSKRLSLSLKLPNVKPSSSTNALTMEPTSKRAEHSRMYRAKHCGESRGLAYRRE